MRSMLNLRHALIHFEVDCFTGLLWLFNLVPPYGLGLSQQHASLGITVDALSRYGVPLNGAHSASPIRSMLNLQHHHRYHISIGRGFW